jgi:hypothetical protein
MTQIPKRSLNACIAPPGVLRHHAENELTNLALHAPVGRAAVSAKSTSA